MDISGLVRAARAETGLSQKGLARRAGISASTLSRFESGAALPSLPTLERLYAMGFQAGFLVHELAPLGVLIGGAWAAALHGLPHEHDVGRLWVAGGTETSRAATAVLRRLMVNLLEDGRPVGAAYDDALLQRHPDSSWVVRGVQFRLTVLDETQAWPTEVRLSGTAGPLRVLAPHELGEQEGVRPEVLQRWLERRSARCEQQPGDGEQDDEDRHLTR